MRFFGLHWRQLHHSIIVRVLLFFVLSVIVIEGARALYTLRMLKSETVHTTTAAQLALAQGLSAGTSQKIALRQSTLQALAQALPTELLTRPAALRQWLRTQQDVLKPLFDGLSIAGAQDVVIAEYPPRLKPFVAAHGSATHGVQIGWVDQVPVVSMTATSPQTTGQPTVVLRGLSKLVVPGFLDAVQTHPNGQTGVSLIVFDKEQLYIDLSDSTPRFQPTPAQESGSMFSVGMPGVQPAGKLVDTEGKEVLAATYPVAGLPWRVVASMPVKEAYLPYDRKVEDLLHMVLISVPPLILYICLLAYFNILRSLRPAARLADQMSRGETQMTRLPIEKPDEVGALTAAFNRLLDRLDEKSRELAKQKETAEAAASAKSRFLAAASHDLRQPMHALNLYLGALSQFKLPAAARPVMASARECAQTMDEMFRALLDISKLDASTMRADIRTFAIAPLLEKIRIGYVQQAHAKGLELRVAHCSAFVASDPELLERVLSNLVSNAVRYTEHGKVLLGCRRTASGLRLTVYDTGPGIALDQQQAVFEEFYQVGNPERNHAHGLGLGLAIVQRLAVLLNASLALHSEPGRGSVFSIEVPRAHPIAQISQTQGPAVSEQRATLQGALIIVIDDESAILDATALVLRQWGCTVVTASSGAEAIESLALCERVPDAIVCDHRLRDAETGVEVIDALHSEFNFDIPAILITGDTSPERMQSIQSTGIPVLNKPLQDHELVNALRGLINRVMPG